MPRPATLTLIISGLHEQPSVDNCGRDSDRNSAKDSILGLIAGRGQVRQKWNARSADEARLECWQRGLLQSLSLNEHDYPSAPVAAFSADGNRVCDWLHAEPVHLSAGMNEVSLVPLQPSFQLTEPERDALTPAIRAHLADEGFELRTTATGWLIGSQQLLEVSTVCVDYAMRHEWSDVLPKGDDAGRVRRLMTELQMLLHEHPVNEVRAARGVPVVNSLWLWGNGRVAANSYSSASVTCMGNDEYLHGICRINGWPITLDQHSAAALLDRMPNTGTTLSVLKNLTTDELESNWLEPIVGALKRGRFARLEIVLDEWQLTIDRWKLQKFWRRAVPVRSWMRT